MASYDVGLGTVEIDEADVVRVVLQYLAESGLATSAATLEDEAGVRVNAVSDRASLVEDVKKGRWAEALPRLAKLDLPAAAAADVWEHVVRELVDVREPAAARDVCRGAAPLVALRGSDPERHADLERLLASADRFERLGGESYGAGDRLDAWDGGDRDAKRRRVADVVQNAVGEVAPARLTTLLGSALKWRAHVGGLAARGRVDVFRGEPKGVKGSKGGDEAAKPPKRHAGAIRLGAGSRPLCACFSPDGTALVTGSGDGFVEVWDPATCRLRTDLSYQANDELMMHDAPVLALACAPDGTALASGCRDGCLKVWRLATGGCARKFAKAQAGAVTAVAWSRDGTQLATGGADGTVRTHGLRSGRQLQQLRGHQAAVCAVDYCRAAAFGAAEDRVVSASADGRVVLWDARSAAPLQTVKCADALAKRDRTTVPPTEQGKAVVALLPVPGDDAKYVVVDRSRRAALVDARSGVAYQCYDSGADPAKEPTVHDGAPARTPGCAFVAAALAQPRGDLLYCVGEDRYLYAFTVATGNLERVLPLDGLGDIAGLVVHPHRNLVAVFGDADTLKLWKH